ncbi:MAG: hypothetical protein IJD55_03545 [Clostridia bacterium]|nr:hypothetical protein [Clostridia bacterium]
MGFTFDSYKRLLQNILDKEYRISDFHNFKNDEKICILRHDVDLSVDSALNIAELENQMGITSTYYVLLNTEFYNLQYTPTCDKIKKIINYNHKIGLHFDAKLYEGADNETLKKALKNEIDLLSNITNIKIESFSIHRPTISQIESNISIDGIINTYSPKFFKEFKYISDSRMRWRESPEDIVNSNKYKQLQILTHPIWYGEKQKNISEILKGFLENRAKETYRNLENNITDLDSVL